MTNGLVFLGKMENQHPIRGLSQQLLTLRMSKKSSSTSQWVMYRCVIVVFSWKFEHHIRQRFPGIKGNTYSKNVPDGTKATAAIPEIQGGDILVSLPAGNQTKNKNVI
jgi:hypothetical protein